MSNVDIICHGCGSTQANVSLSRIASMVCGKCGTSDDLDVWEKTAASPGTGWNKPMPNQDANWDEYAGPAVGPNPLADKHLVGDEDAYDDRDYSRGNPGYIPGGGYDNAPHHLGPTTGIPPIEEWDAHKGPQSGGARWQGKGASLVPLHVTLPNGTVWEGTGTVVKASRPAPKKKTEKESQLLRMTAAIRQRNSGLTEDEIKTLAQRAFDKWGSN